MGINLILGCLKTNTVFSDFIEWNEMSNPIQQTKHHFVRPIILKAGMIDHLSVVKQETGERESGFFATLIKNPSRLRRCHMGLSLTPQAHRAASFSAEKIRKTYLSTSTWRNFLGVFLYTRIFFCSKLIYRAFFSLPRQVISG